MTINYVTLTNTIKALSEVGKVKLIDKLLDNLQHNEIPKSERHNKKKDLTTSYFAIDLNDNEVNEIIRILEEIQLKFLDDGDGNDQKYYYYLELIDNWI
ncbi:hypothetical protein [Flavobacterium aquicola]|uniref:Uncharacterized protein n=1 Tax=Flavobacterium aquicola TaxID=1682742 RepID=A0A3E0EPA1_9FLAO|nr:hypothetical protein [Flavobacterium aquicola]REH00073.1 hypothetical protein C8P67_10341 [Flavobacterium aquicola]